MLDTSEIEKIQAEFGKFNGFYKTSDARQIIYDLYKGKCASTGKKIALADADIGHIIPQSDPAYFESMFPGLDVHNIINLQLLKAGENRKVGNTYVKNPLFLATAYAYTTRLVRTRLHKVVGNAPTQSFDPAYWIEALTHRHTVDFSRSMASAVPYRDYLLISADLVAQDYAAATKGTPFQAASLSENEHQAERAFPYQEVIKALIENQLCVQVSSRHRNTSMGAHCDELFWDLNNKRSIGIPKRLRQPGPPPAPEEICDIPDGDWLIVSQKEARPDPIAHIETIDESHCANLLALRVLADKEKNPEIIGKVGPSNVVLIKNAKNLKHLYDVWACRYQLSGQNSVIDFDAPIEFRDEGYSCSEAFSKLSYRFAAKAHDEFAIMKKRDYAALMKRLQNAVIKDLKAAGLMD
jgi:hypothetical protein